MFLPRLSLDFDPPVYISLVAGIMGMNTMPDLPVEKWGLTYFFAQTGLEP
jgi:hypothetical protein